MYGDISGYNNGKGGGGGKRAVAGPADFYRRVPTEMTEVCILCIVFSLFIILANQP